jgi:hypothetical protein
METKLKKLSLYVASFCLFFLLGSAAQAQQFDVDFGVSGLTAPPTNAITPTVGGGAYPSFGMDFLFYKNFGVGFNAAFRASQNLYQGFQPFRPFFYDVDAVYGPFLHAISERQPIYRLYRLRQQQSLPGPVWGRIALLRDAQDLCWPNGPRLFGPQQR